MLTKLLKILTLIPIMFLLNNIYANPDSELAQDNSLHTFSYDFFLDNQDIGDHDIYISKTATGYAVTEHTDIEISEWWGNFKLGYFHRETFLASLEFVGSETAVLEDNTFYHVNIQYRKHNWWGKSIVIPKLTKEHQRHIKSFGLEKSLSGIAISEYEKSLRHSSTNFTQGSFDTTINNLPFYFENISDIPDTLQLLDTESLKIIEVSLTDFGRTSMNLGDHVIEARHIQLRSALHGPWNIWININPKKIAHFVRFSGSDTDGYFDLKIKTP